MTADLGAGIDLGRFFRPTSRYLKGPLQLFRSYKTENLRPDLLAGLTVAVILLPQGIAYALIAELEPQMGLYAAIIGAIFGALWGSSNHVHTGPTNTISLLVLSALTSVYAAGTSDFIVAAGIMAVMVGVMQLTMGLARLGMLVNFVSHSVIVGFASGAGILIGIRQVKPLLGLQFESHSIWQTVFGIIASLPATHLATGILGLGSILLLVLIRLINPRLPSALLTMIVCSAAVFLFGLDESGVAVIGQLPRGLPPLASLPLLDLARIARLSTGALAVAAIGLVETTAIARSVATQSGQRLDSNQEFVGQGLANIFAGIFSGFPCAGSFTRTAVNYKAGAETRLSAVFASLFVLAAMFVLAPLAAFLPRAALAGVLIVTAYGMIDRDELVRILRSTQGDALIMIVTLLATLFLEIEFAVLMGILLSFARYIIRTSTPRVHAVLPDDEFRHFTYQPHKAHCPQLGIIEIFGDLYFGAVNHVEEVILDHIENHPGQRYLLIRMHHVNNCDFSGIHMLENVIHTFRERGGDVYLVRVNYRVKQVMATTGFHHHCLNLANILDEDVAISHLFYRELDPAVCIYECPVRAFKECLNLPKRTDLIELPVLPAAVAQAVNDLSPEQLWRQLHNGAEAPRPYVIDVREPREYRSGHIAEAASVPLPYILARESELPLDRAVVFVCRSGRRSRRAAFAAKNQGLDNVYVLKGGMLAWEAANLLEAVE